MLGLEAGAIYNQAAGYFGNRFHLDQTILTHGSTSRHQVNDPFRQTDQRRKQTANAARAQQFDEADDQVDEKEDDGTHLGVRITDLDADWQF